MATVLTIMKRYQNRQLSYSGESVKENLVKVYSLLAIILVVFVNEVLLMMCTVLQNLASVQF